MNINIKLEEINGLSPIDYIDPLEVTIHFKKPNHVIKFLSNPSEIFNIIIQRKNDYVLLEKSSVIGFPIAGVTVSTKKLTKLDESEYRKWKLKGLEDL